MPCFAYFTLTITSGCSDNAEYTQERQGDRKIERKRRGGWIGKREKDEGRERVSVEVWD